MQVRAADTAFRVFCIHPPEIRETMRIRGENPHVDKENEILTGVSGSRAGEKMRRASVDGLFSPGAGRSAVRIVVGSHRKLAVPKNGRDGFEVHARVQEQGRRRVAQVVEPDRRHPSLLAELVEDADDVSRAQRRPDVRGEDKAPRVPAPLAPGLLAPHPLVLLLPQQRLAGERRHKERTETASISLVTAATDHTHAAAYQRLTTSPSRGRHLLRRTLCFPLAGPER